MLLSRPRWLPGWLSPSSGHRIFFSSSLSPLLRCHQCPLSLGSPICQRVTVTAQQKMVRGLETRGQARRGRGLADSPVIVGTDGRCLFSEDGPITSCMIATDPSVSCLSTSTFLSSLLYHLLSSFLPGSIKYDILSWKHLDVGKSLSTFSTFSPPIPSSICILPVAPTIR